MAKRFIFDSTRCTGCHACLVACSIKNKLSPGQSYRQLQTFNDRHHPELINIHLSIACNHCSNPLCLQNCPTGAYSKDSATGAVMIDSSICIGCKYCSLTCPYDAPSYSEELGITEKCDFCQDRLEAGESPACVQLCPTGALDIEDFEPTPYTKDATNSQPGFSETTTRPALRIESFKADARPVTCSQKTKNSVISTFFGKLKSTDLPKTSLSSEWPLLLFTSLVPLQVALVFCHLTSKISLNLIAILLSVVVGMGLSAVHLGKIQHGYRALLNGATSWLSREIMLSFGFLATIALSVLFSPPPLPLGLITFFSGMLLLLAIDSIYSAILRGTPVIIDNETVTLTTLIYIMILSGHPLVAMVPMSLKTYFHFHQKPSPFIHLRSLQQITFRIRLLLGLFCPLILLIFQPPGGRWLLFSSVFLAEVTSRLWFYLNLDVPTPHNQMSRDFKEAEQNLRERKGALHK